MKEIQSVQFERKRKFLLVMPAIVTPFIVFLSWVLGIVGPTEVVAQQQGSSGLNLNLPAPVPANDSTWDKLKFYEQADKDSARIRKLQKQDPYFNKRKAVNDLLNQPVSKPDNPLEGDNALNEADEQERKVYEKISRIHREIERPAPRPKPVINKPRHSREKQVVNNDVDRLERMMTMMNNKEPEEDPEMQQLNALMEKIMDVQHPERVSERAKTDEANPKVYNAQLQPEAVTLVSVATNRFYSMDNAEDGNTLPNIIGAVVFETQTAGSGDLLKLRLTQPLFINGNEVQENQIVYGQVKISGNRVLVHIPMIQANRHFLPVALDVIGHDGLAGIPMSNAKAVEAIGNAANRSTQALSLSALDPSLGAQVAGAVLQSGKSLLKKQTKAVRYTIPAGYSVVLRNAN